MPDKPLPGRGYNVSPTPFDYLKRLVTFIRVLVARFRFPHAIYFGKNRDQWNDWYDERYEWMMGNIEEPLRNIWIDIEMVTLVDRYTMPETWIKGSVRFKRLEDMMLYKMRWS